ncbi:hypothetical protein HDU78_010402 [Chytriomyces hyalinus]|nr:hypothetical protein HDU78_010402 [Chytriomyces hyalinus]
MKGKVTSMADNRRFLNVKYKSRPITQVDVAGITRFGILQDAIKAKYSNALALVDADEIQLHDDHNNPVTDLDYIADDYYEKIQNGGLVLTIQTTSPESTFTSSWDFTRADSAEVAVKKQWIRGDPVPEATARFQAFKAAKFLDGCIVSPSEVLLPYAGSNLKKLYVRKCYEELFEDFLSRVERGRMFFTISGTPGIGKSAFFIYILHWLMERQSGKTSISRASRYNPANVVYQTIVGFECFDLASATVFSVTPREAQDIVYESETLYIIDGDALPLQRVCVTLFIGSPLSKVFLQYIERKMPVEWHFPVWTLAELEECHLKCYSTIPIRQVRERYGFCGGVPQIVFDPNTATNIPARIVAALADVNALEALNWFANPTRIPPNSHNLMHMLVGTSGVERPFQFQGLDLASRYIGEKLLEKHAAQMMPLVQEMLARQHHLISP